MLGFFPKTLVLIAGKEPEQWSITRAGRGKSTVAINSQFQCLVPKNTKVVKGDIVTIESQKHFVTTVEKSFVNTVAKVYLVNCEIDIVAIKKHMVGKDKLWDYEEVKASDVPSYFEDVTAKMAQYDMGLLPKVTRRFLISSRAPIAITDRVKFNGSNMMVEGIDTSKFTGLLWVQCSNDTRSTKII